MELIATHPFTRKLIARAVTGGKLAHAFLLVGPEGAGKRTLAREFAGALLCEKRSFPPCLQCGPCRRMEAGTHPDLTVVEAETRNILVKQIREDLIKKLTLHSFEGGFKVAIVPEAERMNDSSQNAFLKTLEEPPADTVLILTCVSLSRLLPTIISRCQVLRIPPLSEEVIVDLVKKQRGLSEPEARLVASLAQGNARRALDLELELVVGRRLEIIRKLLSLTATDRLGIMDFAAGLAKTDYPGETILDLIAGFYWDLLDLKLGRTRLRNQDLAPEAVAKSRRTELSRLLREIEMIQEARRRLLGNANLRLLFEVLALALTAESGKDLLAAR